MVISPEAKALFLCCLPAIGLGCAFAQPKSNPSMKYSTSLILPMSILTASQAMEKPSFHTKGTPSGKHIGTLKPGEYWWNPQLSPSGPVVVLVSIPQQTMHVYRNGMPIRIHLRQSATSRVGCAKLPTRTQKLRKARRKPAGPATFPVSTSQTLFCLPQCFSSPARPANSSSSACVQ
jgi:hypothetical protein